MEGWQTTQNDRLPHAIIESEVLCGTRSIAAIPEGGRRCRWTAVLPAGSANEKVNIGWIGVGTRGYAGLDWLHSASPDDVKITAICDTYQGYIARAKDRMQTVWGSVPTTYLDYRDLLADKSVDRGLHHDPEHLHHDMTIAALQAGKHVYIEKPLAHTIEEGFEIRCAPGSSPARSCRWARRTAVRRLQEYLNWTDLRDGGEYEPRGSSVTVPAPVGTIRYPGPRAFWYRNSDVAQS